MNPTKTIFTILCFVAILASCTRTSKPKANPTIPPKFVETEPFFKKQGQLWFTNEVQDTLAFIEIELANTDKKIETGLMYRKSMEQNQGMLFIFDDEARRSFWMKNTHIPLDIIFINTEKEIVHIASQTKPYSLQSIPSIEYAKYVVEVNAGFCSNFNITTGNHIAYN